jgi:hypothetical protein
MVVKLVRREDFDLGAAFNSVVKHSMEYIDLSGIRQFFKRNGFYAS